MADSDIKQRFDRLPEEERSVIVKIACSILLETLTYSAEAERMRDEALNRFLDYLAATIPSSLEGKARRYAIGFLFSKRYEPYVAEALDRMTSQLREVILKFEREGV